MNSVSLGMNMSMVRTLFHLIWYDMSMVRIVWKYLACCGVLQSIVLSLPPPKQQQKTQTKPQLKHEQMKRNCSMNLVKSKKQIFRPMYISTQIVITIFNTLLITIFITIFITTFIAIFIQYSYHIHTIFARCPIVPTR